MSASSDKMTAQQAWRVLGVAANSSFDDAKVAYKQLCLKKHPDKPGGSKEAFQSLKNAWDFITKNVFRKDGTRIGGAAAAAGGMAGRAAAGRAGSTRPAAHPTNRPGSAAPFWASGPPEGSPAGGAGAWDNFSTRRARVGKAVEEEMDAVFHQLNKEERERIRKKKEDEKKRREKEDWWSDGFGDEEVEPVESSSDEDDYKPGGKRNPAPAIKKKNEKTGVGGTARASGAGGQNSGGDSTPGEKKKKTVEEWMGWQKQKTYRIDMKLCKYFDQYLAPPRGYDASQRETIVERLLDPTKKSYVLRPETAFSDRFLRALSNRDSQIMHADIRKRNEAAEMQLRRAWQRESTSFFAVAATLLECTKAATDEDSAQIEEVDAMIRQVEGERAEEETRLSSAPSGPPGEDLELRVLDAVLVDLRKEKRKIEKRKKRTEEKDIRIAERLKRKGEKRYLLSFDARIDPLDFWQTERDRLISSPKSFPAFQDSSPIDEARLEDWLQESDVEDQFLDGVDEYEDFWKPETLKQLKREHYKVRVPGGIPSPPLVQGKEQPPPARAGAVSSERGLLPGAGTGTSQSGGFVASGLSTSRAPAGGSGYSMSNLGRERISLLRPEEPTNNGPYKGSSSGEPASKRARLDHGQESQSRPPTPVTGGLTAGNKNAAAAASASRVSTPSSAAAPLRPAPKNAPRDRPTTLTRKPPGFFRPVPQPSPKEASSSRSSGPAPSKQGTKVVRNNKTFADDEVSSGMENLTSDSDVMSVHSSSSSSESSQSEHHNRAMRQFHRSKRTRKSESPKNKKHLQSKSPKAKADHVDKSSALGAAGEKGASAGAAELFSPKAAAKAPGGPPRAKEGVVELESSSSESSSSSDEEEEDKPAAVDKFGSSKAPQETFSLPIPSPAAGAGEQAPNPAGPKAPAPAKEKGKAAGAAAGGVISASSSTPAVKFVRSAETKEARTKRLCEAYTILSRKAEKENQFLLPSSFQPLKKKLDTVWPWDETRRAIFSKISKGIRSSEDAKLPPDQMKAQMLAFAASLSDEETAVWPFFFGERAKFKKAIAQGNRPPGVSLEAYIECLSSEECAHLLMWLREPQQIPPETLDELGIANAVAHLKNFTEGAASNEGTADGSLSRQGSSAMNLENAKWAEMEVCAIQKRAAQRNRYFTTTAHLKLYHTDEQYRAGFKWTEATKQLPSDVRNAELKRYKLQQITEMRYFHLKSGGHGIEKIPDRNHSNGKSANASSKDGYGTSKSSKDAQSSAGSSAASSMRSSQQGTRKDRGKPPAEQQNLVREVSTENIPVPRKAVLPAPKAAPAPAPGSPPAPASPPASTAGSPPHFPTAPAVEKDDSDSDSDIVVKNVE